MMPLCHLKDDSLRDQIFSKFRGEKGNFDEYNSYNYDNQSDFYHKLTKQREGPSVKCKKKKNLSEYKVTVFVSPHYNKHPFPVFSSIYNDLGGNREIYFVGVNRG